jgi:hypothetical protein
MAVRKFASAELGEDLCEPREGGAVFCQVVLLDGDEAECKVFLDEFELPRVRFPASVLREKGLGVGSRFLWTMRDGTTIRPADIDPNVPQSDELTESEQRELARLHEASRRRRTEDGGEWQEYTGPGR